MCNTVTTTTKDAKCPRSCDQEHSTFRKCQQAENTGTRCQNPGTVYLGSRTSRVQCPNHRDEGYSQN
ncbi:hypothetical protein CERZMDRAFT_41371 [Cercospora zeae-maydis SCOH1-5]|uniref:Uncharacterized protein n=1 Tax=Cercospora zeae-maydis SCOH1-5 TaxID=717836 RepID=A0A6A6FGV5_9PEZI|nr:hypothetical protein CERZMDRAFT_41371 [Cercospora zeae-maydis SCOH1-5]